MSIPFLLEPRTSYVARFQDCDPFGHLNNARYIDYMISACEDHLNQFYQFDMRASLEQGRGWLVRQHQMVYLKPVRYYESIWIQTSLIAFSESSLQVESLMLDAEQRQFKALLWTKYSCVNTATGQKAVHTPAFLTFCGELQNLKVDPSAGVEARIARLLGKATSA